MKIAAGHHKVIRPVVSKCSRSTSVDLPAGASAQHPGEVALLPRNPCSGLQPLNCQCGGARRRSGGHRGRWPVPAPWGRGPAIDRLPVRPGIKLQRNCRARYFSAFLLEETMTSPNRRSSIGDLVQRERGSVQHLIRARLDLIERTGWPPKALFPAVTASESRKQRWR